MTHNNADIIFAPTRVFSSGKVFDPTIPPTNFFASNLPYDPAQPPEGINKHGTIAGGPYETAYNDYISWLDEHGLATGALAWAEKNLQINGPSHYLDTSHIEHDKKRVIEGYITRTQKRGQPSVVEVNYRIGWNVFVKITNFEMTLSHERDDKKPYRTYRPFKEADGSIKFRLVHEKIDRTYTHDELPLYVNYLLVSAKRALYLTLDNDVCHWHAVVEILDREKPLSKYNAVPVTEKLATLYQTYLLKLNGSREEAVAATHSLVREAMIEEIHFKERLKLGDK